MKIKAFIACWKRPEVTRMCFENVRDHLGIDAFCVLSEKSLAHLCNEFGFEYMYYPNFPVGAKMNAGIWEMMDIDFDFCLQMNSDTILDKRLLTEVYDFDCDYFGVNQCHYYELATGNIIRYTYEEGTVIGAGRMMSKKMLKDVLTRKGIIWREDVNKGLDNHSDFNLTMAGYQARIYDLHPLPYVWDIKTEENIWKFDFFKGRKGAKEVEFKQLPECMNVLDRLTLTV